MHELADADDGEIIKQVQVRYSGVPQSCGWGCWVLLLHADAPGGCAQEYYVDYWALDKTLVSLELEHNACCFLPQSWESQARRPSTRQVRRTRRAATDSACAGNSARIRPHRGWHRHIAPDAKEATCHPLLEDVRLTTPASHSRANTAARRSSDTAQRIAQDVKRLAYEQESALFDFRGDGATLLLIVDRLDDPVTPLLSQWTYQARGLLPSTGCPLSQLAPRRPWCMSCSQSRTTE